METRAALPPGVPPEEGPGQLWNVLRRQRTLILAGLVLGLGAGFAVAGRLETSYEASALILVEEEVPGTLMLSPQQARGEASRLATEMQILQSRALMEEVVDSLHLGLEVVRPRSVPRSALFTRVRTSPAAVSATYRFERQADGRFLVAGPRGRVGVFAPGERIRLPGAELVLAPAAVDHPELEVEVSTRDGAVDRLAAAIEVTQPSREANVIQLAYRGSDPELAQSVPNALAARFIALRTELRTTEARTTGAFLREQIETLRAQLTSAEDRLQGFRQREQVIDLPVEASAQVSRQAQMEAERGALEAERAALGQLLAEARTASSQSGGPSPYRRLLAFPALLRNQAASEMLGSLAKLEDQRAELLTRRKPGDDDVQVLTRRIDQLEEQMAGMVVTYERGLSKQVASMDATLGTFERRLNRLPAKELEFARLSRQTKLLGDMYGLLQTRLKETEIAEAVQDASVRVVDPARQPTRPTDPPGQLVLGISGLFGLLLGIALGFVREYRDVSVHSRGDLQAATSLPVLGWIPRMDRLAEGRNGVSATLRGLRGRVLPRARRTDLAPAGSGLPVPLPLLLPEGNSPASAAESYEWVHRNVLFARPDSPVRTLLVTSSLPGEGKTTTAAGLAMTLARRGHKVLLVDADLRRGGMSGLLPSSRGKGLSELLVGTASFAQVVKTVDAGDGKALHYLPAGALPADPAQLLGSVRAQVLLEWLRERYYLVILDSAPLNIFADAAVLGEHADGVVLVARAGVTPFDALVHCAGQCRTARLPVLGTVLNDVDPARDGGYDAAYGWYEYGKAYYAEAASE